MKNSTIPLLLLFLLIANGQNAAASDKQGIFLKYTDFEQIFIGYIARLDYFQEKLENNALTKMEEKMLNILVRVIIFHIKMYLAEKEKAQTRRLLVLETRSTQHLKEKMVAW